MEQFFYTETMTVMNADADFRSLLKPSALLRYVEQISSMHARHFGMDDKFFEDHGVAFLVGKQALRFSRVPRRGETLTLCSRSEKALRGSIKRITTLTDEAGQEVAMVDSRWIMSSRRLQRYGYVTATALESSVRKNRPAMSQGFSLQIRAIQRM